METLAEFVTEMKWAFQAKNLEAWASKFPDYFWAIGHIIFLSPLTTNYNSNQASKHGLIDKQNRIN